MKLLTFFLLSLFSAVLSAQTVGQYELRKRTSTGFTPYGVTLTDGQVIGQVSGVPAAITLTGSGGTAWGDITGTLSAQTDLQNALNAKLSTTAAAATYAPISHTQAWSTITSTPTTLSGYGITDGITAAAVAAGYLPLSGGVLSGPLRVYSQNQTASITVVSNAANELLLDGTHDMPTLTWRWLQEDEENILNVPREMRLMPNITQYEDMYLVLPSAAGAAGQVLAINNVSDAWIFTEWSSVAAPPASLIEIGVACSDETTPLTTGTTKVTFRVPRAMTLTAVRASVTTAPTGSYLVVDINVNGASILTPLLSIDAGEKTSVTALSQAAILTTATAIADDAEITIDIDQVGSTVAGAGLKVWLIGTRTAP